jgi:PIN domain
MKLLIDANILLDVLQNREGFVKDSAIIWKLCETEKAEGYVSVLTFANLVYIMRKEMNPIKIREVLNQLSLIFEVTELTAADLTRAAELQLSDFEDAVQSVTAQKVHADYIVTRNVRDFTKSRVIAFTPSELLARI